MSFTEIPGPSSFRLPGVYAEVNNSRANVGLVDNEKRILVLGQRTSAGTVAAATPTLVTSKAQAVTYFGIGSMLAGMFDTLFDSNPFTEKWCVALDDNGAGVAANGTITVTGPATAAGTLNLYIGGELVQVAVASGDANTTVATAINTAINLLDDLPVTSTVNSGVVTVTYNHKGTVGNYVDMRINYRGTFGGESTPAGIGITIVQMASGASNPTLTSALAAIPEEIFDYWLFPWTDSTSLTAIEGALTSRWNALRQLEGHAVTGYSGSVATVDTFGSTRNSQHLTVIDAQYNSPTPPHIWAADALGQIAFSAAIDPARPFNTLPLANVLAPPVANRRTNSERNTLLFDGISTVTVDQTGMCRLERVITTYETNAGGSPDPSYLEANTMFVISHIRQTTKYRLSQVFPRFKLVDDDTRISVGQAAVSPKIIKGEIIALAGLWKQEGVVEDLAQFKEDLVVERNLSDPTRVDVILPPNIVNPLHIIAISIQFRV